MFRPRYRTEGGAFLARVCRGPGPRVGAAGRRGVAARGAAYDRVMGTPVDPFTRWTEISNGSGGAAAYQQRFDALAEEGVEVHGEARLVTDLVGPPPARVLDAGCGTGRVAIELVRQGYDAVGVDADLAMLEVARRRGPGTLFVHQDLSRLYLRAPAFDAVVLAGNVIPLLAPDTLDATIERLAAHLVPGGLLISGFGLDPDHLPGACPVTPLADYDRVCGVHGLTRSHRWSTWDRARWSPESGYAVSVHRLLD